jgi:hypothetical protein
VPGLECISFKFLVPAFRLPPPPLPPPAETPSFHFYDNSVVMATAVVYPRAHHGRGFAHVRERRSPQAGVSSSLLVAATPVTDSTEATSTPEPASTIQLPTDVKALTGIIVVLGVCIIGE